MTDRSKNTKSSKDSAGTGVNRRDIIIGAAATAGAMLASPLSGAFATGDETVKRLLYVTNNPAQTIDVYDIDDGHKLLRSFPMKGKVVGGVSADAASGQLFVTQQQEDTVSAYDLVSGDLLWELNTLKTYGLNHPDRICNAADGSALFVPMKGSDVTLILDPATGERIGQFDRPGRPHNSFSGEQGRYIYVGGRSHHTMYLADQRTHKVVKEIGPFSWPVRPFSVDRAERYMYVNTTYLVGFAVADIETGEIVDIHHTPPLERMQHWEKIRHGDKLPHGDGPYSHGIAVRPGADEVWYIDDQFGYLNVFDTSKTPLKPTFKYHVELFDAIDEPWGKDSENRWVAFSIDGKYCYPSDGSIVDAEAGKKTAMRISPSEKLVEVQFKGDKPVRVSGQMGGVYPA